MEKYSIILYIKAAFYKATGFVFLEITVESEKTTMHGEVSIQYSAVSPGRRILVTSDIHGHLGHLKAVLAKAAFCADDLLIIVGDLLEKGPESLNTLRYVMDLCREGNVIVLAGNVDFWRVQMFDNLDENTAADFLAYLRKMRAWKGTCFFDEMTRELGFIAESPDELLVRKASLAEHFKCEFDYLRSLPTILETSHYIFVHGGLPDRVIHALTGRNAFDVLKYEHFLASGLCFDKYVVVGHWPVTLYGDKIAQSDPIISREQKILSIDGGCGIKEDGQLNLVVIPNIDCSIDDVYHIRYDALPVYTAKNTQAASADSINIHWTDNQIRILEKAGDYAYIEHLSSNRRLWIYNEFLYDENRCDDYTDYHLPVCAGDRLSLIKRTPKGYLVKKDGVTGWYFGELEDM